MIKIISDILCIIKYNNIIIVTIRPAQYFENSKTIHKSNKINSIKQLIKLSKTHCFN